MDSLKRWVSAHKALVVLAIIALVLGVLWTRAVSQETARSVTVTAPADKDLYLAGETVDVRTDVTGDVTAAGQKLNVAGRISGDLILAGERIDIAGEVLDDVRAAGRRVDLRARVGGHVVMAGAEITLEDASRITDWAWLAGQRIDIGGEIGNELRAAGETVVVYGSVGGDADILAQNLRVAAGASIGGNLIWRGSGEPDISPDAALDGDLIHRPFQRRDEPESSVFGTLFFLFAAGLLAVLIAMITPDFATDLGRLFNTRPALTFGVALAVLLVTPLIIAICLASVIGIFAGIAVSFAFLTLVIIGFPMGMLALATAGAAKVGRPVDTRGSLLSAIVLAALILWVASWIPLLGGLALLAAWLIGIGTFETQVYQRLRSA